MQENDNAAGQPLVAIDGLRCGGRAVDARIPAESRAGALRDLAGGVGGVSHYLLSAGCRGQSRAVVHGVVSLIGGPAPAVRRDAGDQPAFSGASTSLSSTGAAFRRSPSIAPVDCMARRICHDHSLLARALASSPISRAVWHLCRTRRLRHLPAEARAAAAHRRAVDTGTTH